ncbi:endothelin-converting enzyme homolog [Dermacentor silvarum]|uniref:endothelin-converting enzyme homolog n=1 Tax=Dermacentor silvarum TaxID=543639 RepID=UPI00189ADCAA|nr:endothelin-converting enzyme homolog [Dermacentor silvarum]
MLKFEFDATWARDLAYHWLFVLLVVFAIGLAPPLALWLQFNFHTYCDDSNCSDIVEELRRSLDLQADPCDNFYKFVCGRWELTNRPFADQASQHRHRFRQELAAAMLHREPRRHDQGAVDKAARLYKECRYKPFDDSCQLNTVASVLANLNITWPFTNLHSASLWNLPVTIALTKAHLHHGLDILYAMGVVFRGVKHKRKIVLHIGHLLPLPEPLLSRTQLSRAVVDLAAMMGPVGVDYKHLAKLVQAQEQSLATFLKEGPAEEDENTMVTFEEAEMRFPKHNWTLIRTLINSEVGSTLTVEDHLYINSRALEAATSVLKDGAAVHAFLGWRIVRMLTPMGCGLAGIALAQAAGGDVDVVSDLLARGTLDRLQEHMPMALAAPYIEQKRPGEAREGLQWHIARLMQSFEKVFYNSAYLSRNFQRRAARLMKRFKPHLLYPDYTHLEVQVDRGYRYMPDFDGDCLNMTLTLLRESSRHRLRQLGKAGALYGEGWELPQTSVRALYSLEADALFVPLGVAAAPLYAAGAPATWKLGALGTVLGQEIADTVLGLADSWHQLTKPEEHCFVNASLAHAQAVQGAYNALSLAVYEGGAAIGRQRLRGLERFGDAQLLFLASCFTLCHVDGDEAARNEALCNEAMRNSLDFAQSFQCLPNSAMNPTDKCSL